MTIRARARKDDMKIKVGVKKMPGQRQSETK
jgi:hypothetical protein